MIIIVLLLLLACFNVTMADYLYNNPNYYQLDAYTWESDDFRSMRIGDWLSGGRPFDYGELTALMVESEYDLTKADGTAPRPERIMARKPVEFQKLKKAYQTILEDLRYFPVPESTDPQSPPVTFENGWMASRTYGGERGHEGCDIMGSQRGRGYYPVVSMSDGVVERVGWLEKGGWRIGIRTPGGVYIYYAHLYGYSRTFNVGDPVKAGELLGFMGDSGYGMEEGTVGNFDVHLHVGLYIRTDHYDELSVNPYWLLKFLEKHKLRYEY